MKEAQYFRLVTIHEDGRVETVIRVPSDYTTAGGWASVGHVGNVSADEIFISPSLGKFNPLTIIQRDSTVVVFKGMKEKKKKYCDTMNKCSKCKHSDGCKACQSCDGVNGFVGKKRQNETQVVLSHLLYELDKCNRQAEAARESLLQQQEYIKDVEKRLHQLSQTEELFEITR